MGYLEDLQVQINNRDFAKFWQLWEEYCTSDTVDYEEFAGILKAIKNSDFAKQFGQYVETALPIWELVKDPEESYAILRLLVDLQSTNSPKLADITLKHLTERYGSQPSFNDRLRLVGLRTKDNFQGALSNFDLLAHMEKGKFVFHTGGWGAGRIFDISPLREQVGVEFEHIPGKKYFSFSNAFKTLVPLKDDSFLARRYALADELEQEAKANPVAIIKLLLKDLGPKSAAEIKDEMCELVIPEPEWAKWWQAARTKIKKDTMIETPESLKESFKLHKAEVTHEMRLHKAMGKQKGIDELLQTSYSFVRDNPAMLKKEDVKKSIEDKLVAALTDPEISKAQELQILIFLENQFGKTSQSVQKTIQELEDIDQVVENIEIIAFKKRVLTLIREHREDWTKIFLDFLFTPQQGTLREYIVKELNKGETRKLLVVKMKELVENPIIAPEFFVWYFQNILNKETENLPYNDKEGVGVLFESFLILFAALDMRTGYKDLSKKMYTMLSGKRYALVRSMIEGKSIEFIKEFLLLVSKCQSFTDHDQKILRSLAEVVHPSLNPHKNKEKNSHDSHTLWTTADGYTRTKSRMEQISSVETVENAREIEAARALGDLRENAEYKSALEKRSRLQGELRHLSEQIRHARIITHEDISLEEVGIGNVVEVLDPQGNKLHYTILGAWDADADRGILSSQSKLAQAMLGHKAGEKFVFRDEEYKIVSLKSFLK